jgi:hypothetical protein
VQKKGEELNDFQRNLLDIEILSNLRFGCLEIRDTSVMRVTNNHLDRYKPPRNGAGGLAEIITPKSQLTTQFRRCASPYFSKLYNKISSGLCAPREQLLCSREVKTCSLFSQVQLFALYLDKKSQDDRGGALPR